MSEKASMSELAKREERTAYKLLIPAFLVLILIAFYPLAQVFVTSFTNKEFASSQETKFIGLENYKELLGVTVKELPPVKENGKIKVDQSGKTVYKPPFEVLPEEPRRYEELTTLSLFGNKYVLGASDPTFLKAIWNTLLFTIFSVFFETLLGLIIALTLNSEFKGRGFMRTVMLVPWSVITVVSAVMWQWMFEPSRMGFFNMFFEKIGLSNGQTAFLSMDTFQLPAIIAVDVWKTTPFMALLILAGLQLIPNELYEAAEVDGASKVYQFFTITLPLLKPSIAVALIFRTLDALRVFDVFQVMLSSRRYSMATYNYFKLIQNKEMGLASSIGVLIFFLIFGFAILYIRSLGVDTE